LDRDSILGGENLTPFWNELSAAISNVLSLPTKTDLPDLASSLIEWLCEKFDCKLVVLYQQKYSPQAELVQDMLSVVHCFSSRVYGLRKYEKQLRQDSEIQKQKTTLTEIDSEVSAELCEKNSGLS
jgi:predicted site-specific integrase-resolvase